MPLWQWTRTVPPDAMADEMFARYEARVAEDPNNHAMDYVHSYFHASKA